MGLGKAPRGLRVCLCPEKTTGGLSGSVSQDLSAMSLE